MAYVQKDNSGSLWRNDKGGVESRPDRSGSAMVGGKEYWVKGWLKQHETKGQWLSLSFEEKGEKKPQPRGSMKDELDDGDSIPF